ncbi:protease Do-like 9 isoform X1 [Rhododendron vialii]|uniref:protease Do-like 9 isoform X1 n=1 Tax=Rhododendron vialii TaxID=182163 RepID=UPI00265EC812|nr:protease Do-like 9 isoform X1 [Rhododendron vialii]
MLATTSSPISHPLFCKFIKSFTIDPQKSFRWPSVVSSPPIPSARLPVAAESCQSFLSISSSYDQVFVPGHCLLHDNAIIRSFSSRASVSDDIFPLGRTMLHDAVVKVFCITAKPDFSFPWETEQQESYGSGLVVRGRRVLTTAHLVDHHTLVKLKKHNCDTWYTATVLAIAPECDLAMLTITDDEFWKGVEPVEFGDMPLPGDEVVVTGYREDKDYMYLMTAWASSFRMTRYSFWGTELLAFQVLEAIKGVICSGPVFNEVHKCVGMKFQSNEDESDVIPAEVIEHFIRDYDRNGAYTGLPLLGIKWQKMENPCLRMFMNMKHDQQGVLITQVKPYYPESAILKPYDVILSIDGININNDGTVPFLRERRVEFIYLIGGKYNGDKIVIKVCRGSEIREFITELATHKQFVPANITGMPLPYYIIGGFVFTTLSIPYLKDMDDRDGRYEIDGDYETPDEDKLFSQALYEERVVLSQILEADINAGYETGCMVQNQVLVTFNNKPVEGLKSLVSMVETCNEDFMKFTFGNSKIMVLPTNIARSRTPDILEARSRSCACLLI